MFRFLLTPKIDMKCLCLQAMAIVYGRHHEDIGPFNDTKYNVMFRFLLTPKIDMKCLCLQAMAIVYGRHHEDIGPFNDTKYILAMLDRNTFLHLC